MGDPIWLDNNTVDLALKGDPSINEQLSNYRRAGRKLLMPPAAAQELLDGNVFTMERGNRKHKPVWEKAPTARSRAAMKMGMKQAGHRSGHFWEQKSSMSRRVDYKLQRIENISESDRIILGDIKAGAELRSISKPQMITDEEEIRP